MNPIELEASCDSMEYNPQSSKLHHRTTLSSHHAFNSSLHPTATPSSHHINSMSTIVPIAPTNTNSDVFFSRILNKYFDCMTRQTSDWKKHFDCFDELEQQIEQDIRWPQERLGIASRNPACQDLLKMQDVIRTLDDVSCAFTMGHVLVKDAVSNSKNPGIFENVVLFSSAANDLKRVNVINKMSTRYGLDRVSVVDCDMETQETLAAHLLGKSFHAKNATLFNKSFR